MTLDFEALRLLERLGTRVIVVNELPRQEPELKCPEFKVPKLKELKKQNDKAWYRRFERRTRS
jgi:hypothetical protein